MKTIGLSKWLLALSIIIAANSASGEDLKIHRIEIDTSRGQTIFVGDPSASTRLERPANTDICSVRIYFNQPSAAAYVQFVGNAKSNGETYYSQTGFQNATAGRALAPGCTGGSWPTGMAATLDGVSDDEYELHYTIWLSNGFAFGGKDQSHVGLTTQSDTSIAAMTFWVQKKQ